MSSSFSSFWDPWEVVDPFDMLRRAWNEDFPEFAGQPAGRSPFLEAAPGQAGALTTTGQGQQVGPFGQTVSPFHRRQRRNPIRMDMIESPEAVTVIAEMPGFNKEDIRINVDENNIMDITAERREERAQQPGETIPHRELHYGMYKRVFKLPSYADPQTVQTEFKNGMLGIKFGRRQVPGHRQITVQ